MSPGYECRNAPGMMLAYITSDIGTHHARAWVLGHDVVGTSANVHDLISSNTKKRGQALSYEKFLLHYAGKD